MKCTINIKWVDLPEHQHPVMEAISDTDSLTKRKLSWWRLGTYAKNDRHRLNQSPLKEHHFDLDSLHTTAAVSFVPVESIDRQMTEKHNVYGNKPEFLLSY